MSIIQRHLQEKGPVPCAPFDSNQLFVTDRNRGAGGLNICTTTCSRQWDVTSQKSVSDLRSISN
ncbi:hypothetical protein ASPCADRAFT_203231, partial [Aspergillus carbonarius ITEM 5010]